MVRGTYEEGSKNDEMMKLLIGPDWRAITGVGGEKATPKSSPGYDHASYWPAACEEERAWLEWCAANGKGGGKGDEPGF